jgi:hypothetical protein
METILNMSGQLIMVRGPERNATDIVGKPEEDGPVDIINKSSAPLQVWLLTIFI